jgi:hypothetical protein
MTSTLGPVVAEGDVEGGVLSAVELGLLPLHEDDAGEQFEPERVHLLGVIGRYAFLAPEGVAFDASAVLEVRVVVDARTAGDAQPADALADEDGAGLP